MATELQRIPAKGVKFEAFTRQQLGMLQCPIYSAALARDIRPETDFLRDKLKDLGVSVLAQGYEWLRFAKRITSSPKYTEYTKLAALEIAEGSLARDLYAVESKHPGTVAAGVCASGLPTSQLKPVQTAIGTYIAHFTPSDPGRNTAVNASCPGNPDRIELARVRDLTNMIKDVKIAQAKLIESSG